MKQPIRYVVGFMFSDDLQFVVLMRKNKPEWQAGLLNGVGGKIEAEESCAQAMAREFQEEASSVTKPEDWKAFATMKSFDDSWSVECLAIRGNIMSVRTMESEPVEIHRVDSFHPMRRETLENIPWLVGMAVDHLQDGRPHSAVITYPR